tara:strand:- start:95 stop:379 length:285 start_codon:yes stop_codon:yes gene_type:complete
MASLSSANINVSIIPKEKLYKGKKGQYIQLTFVQNNELDQYGNNVSVYVSQSEEERKEKKNKIYLGNGKVVWTDGQNVEPAPKTEPSPKKKLSF